MIDSRQLIPFTFSVQTGQLASLVNVIILTIVGQNLVCFEREGCKGGATQRYGGCRNDAWGLEGCSGHLKCKFFVGNTSRSCGDSR